MLHTIKSSTSFAFLVCLLLVIVSPVFLTGSETEMDRHASYLSPGKEHVTLNRPGSSRINPGASPTLHNCVPKNQNPSTSSNNPSGVRTRKQKAQIKLLAQTFVPNGNITIMRKGAVQKNRSMEDPWTVTTSHYVVKTNISKKAAGEIALIMELLFHSFIQSPVFNVDPRKLDRLTVSVPKNRSEFKEIVSPYTDVSSAVRGLYLKGSRDNKLVAYYFHSDSMKLNNVLLHEGTHQFIDLVTKSSLPIWLEEGLATYFEFSRFQGMKLIEGGINHGRLKNVRRALKGSSGTRNVLPLEQLMRKKDLTAQNYSQVWSFVHFLIHWNNGKLIDRLRKYVDVYKQPGVNPDPVQLFEKTFNVRPKKLQPYWKKYVLQIGR